MDCRRLRATFFVLGLLSAVGLAVPATSATGASATAAERDLEAAAQADPANAAALAEPGYGRMSQAGDGLAYIPPYISSVDGTADCLRALADPLRLDGAHLLHTAGGLVRIGVRCFGELNTDLAADPTGTGFLGLRYVPTGARSTEPACLCEGWGVGHGTPAVPETTAAVCSGTPCVGAANRDDEPVAGLPYPDLTLLEFSHDDPDTDGAGAGTFALSRVQVGTCFEVEHHYFPSLCSPNLFQVDVTVTNISSSSKSVLYRRSIDWDIDPTATSEFITINPGVGTTVYRTCTNGFMTSRPCGAFTFPCSSPHIFGAGSGSAPLIDSGPADRGALFDFDFGSLPAGATLSFTTYYGAAGTEAEADIARAACSLDAWSYGQPNCPSGAACPPGSDGRTAGTPNTFIFGFGNIQFPEFCGNGLVEEGEDCDEGTFCDDLSPCTSDDDCAPGDVCITRDSPTCNADCTVPDNAPPEVTCLDPIVPTDPGECSADVDCEDIATCDDPDGDPTDQTCDPVGPYAEGGTSVTVTCEDPSEASDTEICTVTVVDEELPSCTAPDPLEFECTGPDGISSDDPEIAAWLDEATASDNCGVDTFTHDAPDDFPFGCEPGAETTVTWTVTDDSGNEATCSSTITVVDSAAPAFDGSLPGDVTAECDAVPGPATLTATDLCDSDVTVDFTDSTDPGSCPDEFTIDRTWVAEDDCGNMVVHMQTVTVVDTTPPTFSSLPGDVTVECGAVPSAPTLTATDNCDSAVPVAFEETTIPGSCPDEFVLERVWTAVDDCGNPAVHEQTVTVVDTTPPEIEGSDDILACLWPPNHWYVCFTDDDLPIPDISDSCGEATVEFSGCASNQPDDAPDPEFPGYNGDGSTRNDCVVLPGGEGFCVRAERAGTGPDAKDGRFYGVSVVAVDECGNESPDTVIGSIWVPHDMRGKPKPNCLKTTQVGCKKHEALPCD